MEAHTRGTPTRGPKRLAAIPGRFVASLADLSSLAEPNVYAPSYLRLRTSGDMPQGPL